MTRYELLFIDLIKHTSKATPEKQKLVDIKDQIAALVESLDTYRATSQTRKQLATMFDRIHSRSVSSKPYIIFLRFYQN